MLSAHLMKKGLIYKTTKQINILTQKENTYIKTGEITSIVKTVTIVTLREHII